MELGRRVYMFKHVETQFSLYPLWDGPICHWLDISKRSDRFRQGVKGRLKQILKALKENELNLHKKAGADRCWDGDQVDGTPQKGYSWENHGYNCAVDDRQTDRYR